MSTLYEQYVSNYIDQGYSVHTHAVGYTVLLKRGKPTSAVVVYANGQQTRVLNQMQIEKLLLGEDIMATTAKKKVTTKKKAAPKKKATTAKKKAATTATKPAGDGYKGHRAGSRKGKLHQLCDEKKMDRQTFIAACEKEGIAKTTASSWYGSFKK